MKSKAGKAAPVVDKPEPVWEIAHLFPGQGAWCEDEYLALETNHLVELSQGRIEVLPMPTTSHQLLVAQLYGMLLAFAATRDLGTVLFAGVRIRLCPGTMREPDVVFMLKKHADRMGEEYWEGADLVMEVVSGGAKDRRRDLKIKRQEYAQAGIPEYWIVDPRDERITVLHLEGSEYAVHGEFAKGETATSCLLSGFAVDVTAAFARQTPRGAPKPRRQKTKRKDNGR